MLLATGATGKGELSPDNSLLTSLSYYTLASRRVLLAAGATGKGELSSDNSLLASLSYYTLAPRRVAET